MSWVDPNDIAAVAAASVQVRSAGSIEAVQIRDDEERADLRDAGMSEVAVEGILGMAVGEREVFTPEQPRSVLTTTTSTLAGWAFTHLRPFR